MKRAILLPLVLLITLGVLAGCASTDVVLKYSPESLENILKANSTLVGSDQSGKYYQFTVDNTTRLLVSKDYKMTGTEDILLETPLTPFTAAGLDVAKLGAGYKFDGDTLSLTGDFGDGTGANTTFKDSLFDAVDADRSNLSYHEKLDHYGVKLLKGKFEWAKNYTTNDKDIVFIIAAEPLSELGVDVQNVEGWAFLTIQEPDGSTVDILAKPHDLK